MRHHEFKTESRRTTLLSVLALLSGTHRAGCTLFDTRTPGYPTHLWIHAVLLDTDIRQRLIRWAENYFPPQGSATRLSLRNWCWCDYVTWISGVDGYSSAIRAWQFPQIHCSIYSHTHVPHSPIYAIFTPWGVLRGQVRFSFAERMFSEMYSPALVRYPRPWVASTP